MTLYTVHWTDTITADHRVTNVYLMNNGNPELFAPTIAAAVLGGFQDEGRVHVDSYEVSR